METTLKSLLTVLVTVATHPLTSILMYMHKLYVERLCDSYLISVILFILKSSRRHQLTIVGHCLDSIFSLPLPRLGPLVFFSSFHVFWKQTENLFALVGLRIGGIKSWIWFVKPRLKLWHSKIFNHQVAREKGGGSVWEMRENIFKRRRRLKIVPFSLIKSEKNLFSKSIGLHRIVGRI